MISQKNLRILFILKYISFLLKGNLATYKSQLERLNRVPSDKKVEAKKKELSDQIKDYENRLVLFNQLEQEDITGTDFAKVLNTLIHTYKNDIKQHLVSRFGLNLNQKEEDFDFSSFRDIPKEVLKFLKEPIPDQTFIVYERLENKKMGFFNYNQLKWDFWYWPELCYGKKNQLSTWFYRFAKTLLILAYILLLPASIMMLPPLVAIGIYGPLSVIAGVMAFYQNRQNLMIASIAFLIVIGILAAMFFCPPLSLTLLFGLHLSGAMAMLNFVPCSILLMVAKFIHKIAEPSNNSEQQELFAPSSHSKPQAPQVRHQEKEEALRKVIHEGPSLGKLFKPPSTNPDAKTGVDVKGPGR